MYVHLIFGILSLCISTHLTVLLLLNPVLNLTFSFLPITSGHSYVSASHSTLNCWCYINIWLTVTLTVWLCGCVKDKNCVNRPVCSYLRPIWEQVNVWTCEGWELCESSRVFVPSSSESRPAARVSAPSCSVRQSSWLWEDDFSRQRWTRWTVDVDARFPLPRQRRKFTDFKFTDEFTLWRPLLPYGYSYRTSCARPG